MYSLNAIFSMKIATRLGLMPKKFHAMSCRMSKTMNFQCSVQCYENSFDKAQFTKYFKFDRINFGLNVARNVSMGNILVVSSWWIFHSNWSNWLLWYNRWFALAVINMLGFMGGLSILLGIIIWFWIVLDNRCFWSSSLSTSILVLVQNAIG
jgi:hypothetical protein